MVRDCDKEQETDPNVKIAENKDKKDILKEKIDFKNEIDL